MAHSAVWWLNVDLVFLSAGGKTRFQPLYQIDRTKWYRLKNQRDKKTHNNNNNAQLHTLIINVIYVPIIKLKCKYARNVHTNIDQNQR